MPRTAARPPIESYTRVPDRSAGSNGPCADIELARCGLFLVDEDGVVLLANRGAAELFGYGDLLMRGLSITTLIPDFEWLTAENRPARIASPLVSSSAMADHHVAGLRSDGVMIALEVDFDQFESAWGRSMCVSVTHVPGALSASRQPSVAQGQVEELAYVASHNMRSPIWGATNLIAMIRADLANGEPGIALRNLQRLEQRIEEMDQLVEAVIAFARIDAEPVAYEQVTLAQIIADIVDEPEFAPGFAFVRNVPDQGFLAARAPLSLVLRHVLKNAVQHHDRAAGRVEISAYMDDSQWIIDIRDDGPGIPSAARDRIFGLFQCLSPSTAAGSGMGLPIARRTAARHGATLTLCEQEGERGSRFRLCWPGQPEGDLHG